MNTAHRNIIALTCSPADFVARFHEKLAGVETLWVSDTKMSPVKNTPFKHALTRLGQEVDVVVFNANEALSVNALGALSGCIRGGGALILLLPPDAEQFGTSRFYQRLLRILAEHEVTVGTLQTVSKIFPTLPTRHTHSNTVRPTADQSRTIQAVIKVVTGHRNRPVVITADRGRGKSSAIGMALKQLLSSRSLDVIITAPAKAMVTPLLEHAGQHESLHYIAPDKLVRQLPKAGLLIIDEAGAIPVPILSQLLQQYSRIVFSTTLHGYEGNGRGFAIRFYDKLQQYTPDWQSIALGQPIRWGAGDPLEAFIHHLLLLNAEPEEVLDSAFDPEKVTYRVIDQTELLNDEALLHQLYGLLVIAHYQTRPADLLQMLDSQQLSIHALFSGRQLVAAAIVSHEGGLDGDLALAIYRGERRPKGHLIPQILLSQMGILSAGPLKTDRIMRIAVHPECRRNRLASQSLNAIKQQSKADYLSTSFGLSESLFSFWQQNDFNPVYLGLKREASSGYHSAVFLKPLNDNSQQLMQQSARSFAATLIAQLGDSLKHYDPTLAFLLLTNCQQTSMDLCPQEIQDINRFTRSQCSLGSALAALQRWLPSALINDRQTIKNNEAKLLIMRILQHHNWSHCCEMLGIPGKQVAQRTLQKTVADLAEHLPNTDMSKEG